MIPGGLNMQCTKPMLLSKENFWVPCGHCRACRIARSRQWYTRLYHESVYHDDMCFATITYNDDSLPANQQISKYEMKTFLKRLRHYSGDRKIRYYLCGEYGDKTHRPHYHAIFFGIGFPQHTYDTHYNKRKNQCTNLVTSGPLKQSWTKGNIVIGTVTKDSMRYVTDYVHKKLYGKAKKESNIEQPFSLCSQGLGLQWALDNQKYLTEKGGLTIYGTEMGMPRYYAEKLGLVDQLRTAGSISAIIDNSEYVDKHGMNSMPRIRARKQKDLSLKAYEELYSKGEI